MMHIGPFDNEPVTVNIMNSYLKQNGFQSNFTDKRLHHEIYLSDNRKVTADKLKTIIRHSIKKVSRELIVFYC